MSRKVRLHTVEAGPREGHLVILLHGFPEFWWCWRRYIEPLAQAGYRVVAPDQRGYNLSDKPREVAAYGLDELAGDILGLADERGAQAFSLVGHDWGGSVAWRVAAIRPERVQRLVTINAPHPLTTWRYLRRHPRQMMKSAYMAFFQLPLLPEAVLKISDYRPFLAAFGDAAAGAFSDGDIKRYREAWSRPGALTAMLNWYRAVGRRWPSWRGLKVTAPTIILWGARDRYFEPALAEASLEGRDNANLVWFEYASHWLHHEEPDRVLDAILDHLP